MVLPPLELFSLRKELPCCRAALSVSERILVQPVTSAEDRASAPVPLRPSARIVIDFQAAMWPSRFHLSHGRNAGEHARTRANF